jgi:hypothetical protein
MSVIQLTAEPETAEPENNGKERQPLVAAAGTGQVTVSLVIPTLNEVKNLAHMLLALQDVVDELVIVDGGSTVSADG